VSKAREYDDSQASDILRAKVFDGLVPHFVPSLYLYWHLISIFVTLTYPGPLLFSTTRLVSSQERSSVFAPQPNEGSLIDLSPLNNLQSSK